MVDGGGLEHRDINETAVRAGWFVGLAARVERWRMQP
jgi:hypothetical protein